MKIYKVSHGSNFFSDKERKRAKQDGYISVHPETSAMGRSKETQGDSFVNAKLGDIFYLCNSNQMIDYIGMFDDEMPMWSQVSKKQYDDDWVNRTFVLLFDAKNPKGYDCQDKSWWMPGANSTFTVASDESKFEELVLTPVFEIELAELKRKRDEEYNKLISIDVISSIQKLFETYSKDSNAIVDYLSVLKQSGGYILDKLSYKYGSKDISSPVNAARCEILNHLQAGNKFTLQHFDNILSGIKERCTRNVFKSWGIYGITYPLLAGNIDRYVDIFLSNLSSKLMQDLGIGEMTKCTRFGLPGPRNQGATEGRIWFAIYNRNRKNQNQSHQLFFQIASGGVFEYGHYYYNSETEHIREVESSDIYSYNAILESFRKNKYKILSDEDMKDRHIVDLANQLIEQRNIILTGAPGTGKTYLSKLIAKEITSTNSADYIGSESKEQGSYIKMIQFHPSYDYTDFIEGLRPIDHNGVIGFQRQNGTFKSFCERAIAEPEQKFVFIIDEINRGEISKIFGELFFSVDPGYRGTKGVVQTQYQNLINENDTFYNGFYIPENVYIIGTMNDIDRSVECMDFAMRRRFTWIKVTADSRVEMFGSTDWADEAIKRMQSMNKVIEDVAGLNQSYHVGPAYFLKLETYSGTDKWDKLWCYHLEPLINEYLRGMPDAKTDLEKIKNAYDLKTTNNTNDGQ